VADMVAHAWHPTKAMGVQDLICSRGKKIRYLNRVVGTGYTYTLQKHVRPQKRGRE